MFDIWRRSLAIGFCVLVAGVMWMRIVSAQDIVLPAKNMKDQQQDDHMHNTDVQVMEIRQLLHEVDENDKEIRAQLGDVKLRMGTDEGIATGAFIVLGILETLGLLQRIRPDSNKPTP
jgi:hypothetical protein